MKKTFTLLLWITTFFAISCKRQEEILPQSVQKQETLAQANALTTAAVTPLLVAGKKNEAGFVDGVGANARFNTIAGIFVDGDGSLYVCDFDNSAVRKISTTNKVTTLNISPDAFESPMVMGGPRSVAVLNNGTIGIQSSGHIFIYKNGAVFKDYVHFPLFGYGEFGSIDEGHDGTYFNFITNYQDVPNEVFNSKLGVIKKDVFSGPLKVISTTETSTYLESKLNTTKYVVINARLYKLTDTGSEEVYKDFNPNGTIFNVAVNKAGTDIYIVIDYGSIKRIRNNKLETIITGVKANTIALANSEKFLYYATADNTINRIPLP